MESTDAKELEKFNVIQLKEELKIRFLPTTGIKSELIERLIHDNMIKNENGIMETFQKEKTKRLSEQIELNNLKLELQLLKEKDCQEEKSTNEESSSGKSQSMDTMIIQILQTQSQLLDKLSNQGQATGIQVFSTSDTSQAIPIYGGNKVDNVKEWIKQVERVAALANWSQNLTLVNASMRLRGPASDWHKAYGKNILSWKEWKNNIMERFNIKMSFAEFITYQSKRTLRATETITEYIYNKNAMFERSPTVITDDDKVFILDGIADNRWSIPLATQCCQNIEELLNHASALDKIRKTLPKERYFANSTETVSTNFVNKHKDIQNKNSSFIPRFNPQIDKIEDQTCYKCKNKGHISYNCTMKTENNSENIKNLKTNTNGQKDIPSKSSFSSKSNYNIKENAKQISCIQENIPNVTLISVLVNGSLTLQALPDSGSVLTIIDRKCLPEDTEVYSWQKGSYRVAGSTFTPIGWVSARLQVGKIDYIMPQIAICEDLPVPMILGKDWQLAVYARVIHEPDGKICIVTPTHTEYFPALCTEEKVINCCVEYKKVTKQDEEKVMQLTSEFKDIFKTDSNEIGKFTDFELEIKLKHNKPISCKPYRLPEPERKFLKDTIEKWMEQNICRISKSPYAAPMFVIQQQFHETTPYRPVVDYSKTINPITILDSQPIERMEDIITTVSQYLYKFKLDIYHAYHNICIKEEDIHKTAVITQDYHVEFMRVMFGLVGGPSIMSKVIKSTYGSLYDQGVRAYFDDITGGQNSITEFIQVLRKVFEATREKNLKINKEKCIFITNELPLFGKIVGYKEERTDPKRIAAVEQYKTLSTLTEVRSFLGFTSAFRKYIKNYAQIAKPLQDILKKNKQKQVTKNTIVLSSEQQKSFQNLKDLLISAPVLANFQQDADTIVETDSSYQGMGACLLQVQNGEMKVIEYASRSLKDAETRYHINELEVTAVHWAIVSKFRIYLLGIKFKLVTDSYSTAYIIDKAKINRKFARYVVDLAPFDFTSEHRPGKENVIADHLSRYPLKNVCMLIIGSNTEKLKLAQSKDAFIQQICMKLSKEPITNHLKQIHETFEMCEEILLHVNTKELYNNKKIVVPQSLRQNIIKIAHDDNGHLDFSTTLAKVKTRYWWRSMRQDIKSYVAACMLCAKTNRRTKYAYGKLGERPIPQTPMQVVSSDHIVALPETQSGNTYIFVHIDHATRYIFAKPCYSLSALSVIETIENDIIYVYGPPQTYISDSAPCFTSQAAQNFFNKFGIEHIPTTPYTAQSNGLVERANATLMSTLTKFAMQYSKDWDRLLPKVVLAINMSKQKTTGYSPFYLMFGYEPRIPPEEIHFGTIFEDINRLHQLDLLFEAREKALENIKKVHEYNKVRFDLRRFDHNFKEGDYVLYEWNKPTDDKLTPKYKGPYIINRKVGSVCYEITDVWKPSKKKIVHVQFLKPMSPPPNLNSISELEEDIILDNNLNEGTIAMENSEAEDDKSHKMYVTQRGRLIRMPDSYKE